MGKGIYWPWVPQAFFNAMEKIVEEEEEFKRYVALAASAASAKDLSATKKYLGFATDKEIYRRIKNGITGITYASVAKISEATETYFNMQTALEKDIQEINEYEKAVVLLAQQKKRQADQEARAAAVQAKRRQQQEELDKLKKEIENIK